MVVPHIVAITNVFHPLCYTAVKPSNTSVRLVSPYSGVDFLGRVEVLHNGQWGTVCDRSFTSNDANVVCGMAGFPGAIWTLYNSRYGRGSGTLFPSLLKELSIDQCAI